MMDITGNGGGKPTVLYVLYVIVVISALVINMTWYALLPNWKFKDSFTDMPLPGIHYTDYSDKTYWVILIITVSQTAILWCSIARLANTIEIFTKYLLVILCLIGIGCSVTAVTVLSIEMSGCNNAPTDDPSGLNSLHCNDFRWCCVYGTIDSCPSNTVNFTQNFNHACPLLTQPCNPTVHPQDLTWNWIFSAAYAFMFVFGILNVLLVFISLAMGNGRDPFYYNTFSDNDVSLSSLDDINPSMINSQINTPNPYKEYTITVERKKEKNK